MARTMTMAEANQIAQKRIDELEAQLPRWIPVSERLPDDCYEPVLTIDGDGDMCTRRRHKYSWAIRGVTHWMPLPEPPKGGG